MNIPIEAKIRCPFYTGIKNTVLCCEGIVDNTCMTTKFPSVKERTEYIKSHCFKVDGGECVFAKNLYEKYRRLEAARDEASKKALSAALRKTG